MGLQRPDVFLATQPAVWCVKALKGSSSPNQCLAWSFLHSQSDCWWRGHCCLTPAVWCC